MFPGPTCRPDSTAIVALSLRCCLWRHFGGHLPTVDDTRQLRSRCAIVVPSCGRSCDEKLNFLANYMALKSCVAAIATNKTLFPEGYYQCHPPPPLPPPPPPHPPPPPPHPPLPPPHPGGGCAAACWVRCALPTLSMHTRWARLPSSVLPAPAVQ